MMQQHVFGMLAIALTRSKQQPKQQQILNSTKP